MNASPTEAASARLIEHARRLYRELSKELARAIDRIGGETAAEAKSRTETLRAHRKALQTVLEFELLFTKDEEGGGDALDLEAARAEIFGRLDRLLAAGEGEEMA